MSLEGVEALGVTDDPTIDFWKRFLNTRCRDELSSLGRDYPHRRSFSIDYTKLIAAGPEGLRNADRLIEAPGAVLEDIRDTLVENAMIPGVDTRNKAQKIIPMFINISRRTRIRDLRCDDMDQFVSIEATIRKITEVRPRISKAVFKCPAGHFTEREQRYGTYIEPESCDTDGCTFRKLELVPKRSSWINSQKGLIQETYESLAPGEQPQDIVIDIVGDNVAKVKAGDAVVVNGICRGIQKVTKGSKTPIFDLYIEVNSIELLSTQSSIDLSDADIEKIEQIAQDPNVIAKIVGSIAPDIFGMKDEKLGLALAAFGGVRQKIGDKFRRGSIHVLYVGDPGVAKSELADYLKTLLHRCIKVSGVNTSAAGLTVAANKDEFGEGRWTFEAGVMVLGNRGAVVIDEGDKMDEAAHQSLLEPMEAQIINPAKAGISATFSTQTSLVMTANPKHGRFDMYGDIGEQINIYLPLLSRFDLIYIIQDKPDKDKDLEIANHMIDVYDPDCESRYEPEIPVDLLRKYIIHAQSITPRMSPEAKKICTELYVEKRSGTKEGQSVPLTPRFMNTAARLAQAAARMKLHHTITREDAELAVELLIKTLKMVAYDEKTGTFDIDKLETGVSAATRKAIGSFELAVKTVADPVTRYAKIEDLYSFFEGNKTAEEVDKAIEGFSARNMIIINKGRVKLI